MKAKKSGFTLVEILIVVVILGILAAIVIPQFTEATNAAKTPVFCFGPYLQKIPVNQFNNKLDLAGIHGLLDNTGTVGDNGGSWEYTEATGAIYADDDYDEDGVVGADHMNL